MFGQPALPSARRRLWGGGFFMRRNQPFEPRQAPPQCSNAALSHKTVVWENNAAEKIDALIAALQFYLTRMQFETQKVV